MKELWKEACEWEGIPPDSKFVIFSKDNPFVKAHDAAMGKLLRFKQVQTGEWAPAVVKEAKVYCPMCGNHIDIPDYASVTRTEALRRHIEKEHPMGNWPMPLKEGKLLPALKPFEPYHFAEYVLRYNAFTKAEIPLYSGQTGKNPHRVDDKIWAEVLDGIGGKFARQGDLYVVKLPGGIEKPKYMRASPTWAVPSTAEYEEDDYETYEVDMFCQLCGKQIPSPADFRTAEDLRNYFITGLCQECQDAESQQKPINERYLRCIKAMADFYKKEKREMTLEEFTTIGREHFPDRAEWLEYLKWQETPEGEETRMKWMRLASLSWMNFPQLVACEAHTEPSVIPTKEAMDFIPDSPEFLAYTIDDIGYRDKFDEAFTAAIARANKG